MIDTLKFGKTTHSSSRIIFGAAALSEVTDKEAEDTLQVLKKYGVNHIDTSVTYGDSEKWVGTWMEKDRDSFFLATKIDARTLEEAEAELRVSFDTLKVDQIDLLQMHELVRQQDVDSFFDEENGAFKVLLEARERKWARYIGVTAHGYEAPNLLYQCVTRYPFDSVLLPFNYVLSKNQEYMADFKKLLDTCREKQIAVQTIKSITRSSWENEKKQYATWYKPLENQEDIDRAVHWVMSYPDLFLCSAGDVNILPKVLDAAERYAYPPSESEMEDMRNQLNMKMPAADAWPRLW